MTRPATDAWTGAERIIDESASPRCGRESCDGSCVEQPAGDRASEIPRLRAQHASEIVSAPAPIATIEGVAHADRVTVIVGESGAGNTFVVIDAGAHEVRLAPACGRCGHTRCPRRS